MAQPAATDNVLTTLDDRVPTAFYWQLTLLATLGGFLFGYDTSNIGSALNFVPYNLHGLALGYLVSGASLGAAAGRHPGRAAVDHFGRKTLLVIDAGIYAAGAILSAVTWHAAVLLIARTLIGLAIGADSAIATAYIAEYAPKEPARVADDAAAVDDHDRHPGLRHRRADHLRRLPGQRGHGRLAAGPRPGRRTGAGRAGAADPDARVAAVAAAARPLRGRAQGDGRSGHEASAWTTSAGRPRIVERVEKGAGAGGGPGRRGCAGR